MLPTDALTIQAGSIGRFGCGGCIHDSGWDGQNSDAAIRIFNASGRLVLEERAFARRMTLLDIEFLPSGLYTIQIVEEMRHQKPAICRFTKS